MEIVTEADIFSPEEAYAYLTRLRATLRALGVNSGDMEKGALRCEPNISVRTLARGDRRPLRREGGGQKSQQLPGGAQLNRL
jgi:aspartyl-tRNA(Asn)/glutamyl-tRNA(Gln) amidotransferase subunit B